jgi:hypothetical protein
MISFRVSEREFELLKVKSEAEGARSISDFARSALCAASTGSAERVDPGIHQLSDDIQQLRAHVQRVTELLEASRSAPAERPPLSLTRKSRGA